MGNKTFDFSSKKKDFLPKIGIFGQFWPGPAGLFGALLVGRLVVVARGLFLARHLFTLLELITQDLQFAKYLLPDIKDNLRDKAREAKLSCQVE